ncbi:MAG: UDP-N-acetylmuramoyl-L-alanine--D-glutamate ligase, partial [Planctomycetaceae bacterium]|nr:UDP-N-acetylmuramoyl-L-alanine--D-glutamate ligase [Planctomycetaceae bacterium]
FLAQAGADVTVTDLRSARQLSSAIEDLADLPQIRFVLESHPESLFGECDLLVVNPAIRPDHPLVQFARERGALITTEIDLFLRNCPASIVAVTGTNGKSTTSALISHLLRSCDQKIGRRTWLGGNIGISLLSDLPQIQAKDIVVLELSSFQLEFLRHQAFAPDIAVITSFSPNHLDWHRDLAEYQSAKQVLLNSQTREQWAILPEENSTEPPTESGWRVRGRCLRFGLKDHGESGAFLQSGQLILRREHPRLEEDAIRFRIPAQLPGPHNHRNLAAACAAAWLCHVPIDGIARAVASFEPLPHRLQLVAEKHGRRFYDDSIATTPESAIAALQSFPSSIVLFAGGYDKKQDLSALAGQIHRSVRVVGLMGATADGLEWELKQLQERSDSRFPIIVRGPDFGSVFRRTMKQSQPGDTILLSPGCASFGWFRDYRDRAEQYCRALDHWEDP